MELRVPTVRKQSGPRRAVAARACENNARLPARAQRLRVRQCARVIQTVVAIAADGGVGPHKAAKLGAGAKAKLRHELARRGARAAGAA